jgi:hypothetical protein
MKVVFWLLAVAVATIELGLMIWQLPPRKIEGRLPLETKQPKELPVICPAFPPCWQDGKPIVGSLGSPS